MKSLKIKTWDPKRTNHLIALLLAGAFLVPSFAWGINTIATGYQTTNSHVVIDAHNACQQVRHTSGAAVFIPTKTAVEWTAFRSNKPANIEIIGCPIDGVCAASGSSYTQPSPTCSVGPEWGFQTTADGWVWYCLGQNGGSNTACAVLKRVDGVCDNSVQNGCTAGTANDGAIADDSTYYRWRCDGKHGGINSGTCQKAKPVSCFPDGTYLRTETMCGWDDELTSEPQCCSGGGIRYGGSCEVYCGGLGGF